MKTAQSDQLGDDKIAEFQRDGFVKIEGIVAPSELPRLREAALHMSETMRPKSHNIFTQCVNAWQENETMRSLTMSPEIGRIAEQLTGKKMRLWHDQLLVKQPHNGVPTEFHQDQTYWPHNNSSVSITAWIALNDIPVERGCMSFMPGTHKLTDLGITFTNDPKGFEDEYPDARWIPRVTLPLRAGDCTFHHGRTAHFANANATDEPRIAHAVIYMDTATRYRKWEHVVTDPLNLTEGDLLEGELFPTVDSM